MRFFLLGLPHTVSDPAYVHCAYTMKNFKFAKMMTARGHEVINLDNEGSTAAGEHVQIFTEAERASYFGPHEKQRLYDLLWDGNQDYWKEYGRRCAEALKSRAKKGDFILAITSIYVPTIGAHFPGSYSGVLQGPAIVEYGIGYFGIISQYQVYESQTHRAYCMGEAKKRSEDNSTAVVNNYWNMDEFPRDAPPLEGWPKNSYYLYMGRIVPDKGWGVAVDVTRDIGAKLVMAGQGDPGELPPHVTFLGHANAEMRARLMTNAIASFCPTHFTEPFGGTAVESQLCGTPAITTDHGAFTETVDEEWRCVSHREFIAAAERAKTFPDSEREKLRWRAVERWSLEAIAPRYEAYFNRILARWWGGYYEMRDLDTLELP